MSSALEKYFEEEERLSNIKAAELEKEKAIWEAKQAEEDALRAKMGDELYRQYKRMDEAGQKETLKKRREEEERKKREEEEEKQRVWEAAELKRKTKAYADGCVYIGEHIDDGDKATFEPHGPGTWYWADGDIQYEGMWRYGKKHGFGTYHWRNGDTWTGTFVNDEMQGSGKLVVAATGLTRDCIMRHSRRIAWIEEIGLGCRVEIRAPGGKTVPGGLWEKATVTKVLSKTKREVSYDGLTQPKCQRMDFAACEFRINHAEASAYLLHTPLHEAPNFFQLPKGRRRSSASAALNPSGFRRSSVEGVREIHFPK